jgi:phosphoesterase RecJ-like protein
MVPWSRFVELVGRHRRFVLTAHIRPDCDALGSELAMRAILQGLGKDVLVCNAFAVPPNLLFLDPNGVLKKLDVDVPVEELDKYEALLVLDTSAWAQLGAMADVLRTTKLTKLVLDHHRSEDDLGAEMFKDIEAEATGRLVVEAADALGVPLRPEIAVPAFAALATDTGWFRFSSTRADT